MPTLLVAVTGYGPPNLDHKRPLLEHNLTIIKATFQGPVTVKLFNYGEQPCECPLVDQEIMGPGYVGQFIHGGLMPSTITADYIMCILDDIELHPNYNVGQAIRNLEYYGLDIIQPSLTSDSTYSHECMLQQLYTGAPKDAPTQAPKDAGLRITTFMEYFCYLMPVNGYKKWHSLFDSNTTWLWGIDLCMNQFNIKMGLIDILPMHHYYKRAKGDYLLGPCPKKERNSTIRRLANARTLSVPYSAIVVKWLK